MITKYDVDDTVLIPFKITDIRSCGKDRFCYDGYIMDDDETPLTLGNEENIVGRIIDFKIDAEKEEKLKDALGYYG